jgi:hypothetical protein
MASLAQPLAQLSRGSTLTQLAISRAISLAQSILRTLAVGTSVGGLIGIPAGAIGSRFGKVVSSKLGNSAEPTVFSHTLRQTVTAGSSGFAGGAVFGGVESIREAKSLSDVLSGTFKGGVIGFLTAGATGAFEPRIKTSSSLGLGKPALEPPGEHLPSSGSAIRTPFKASFKAEALLESDARWPSSCW